MPATEVTPRKFLLEIGWVSIIHPDDREQDEQDINYTPTKVVTEVRIIHREGATPLGASYAPHSGRNTNNDRHFMALFRDITESKQIRASLRQREAILQVVADKLNIPDR
ncbi:MAG: hypothetical protein IPL78_09150 [Chloroflexi bacterium]|nr:hypothetical protein [Chloroflexota bacterium]